MTAEETPRRMGATGSVATAAEERQTPSNDSRRPVHAIREVLPPQPLLGISVASFGPLSATSQPRARKEPPERGCSGGENRCVASNSGGGTRTPDTRIMIPLL